MGAEHRHNVTLWWAEVLGGPDRDTRELCGDERMLGRHRAWRSRPSSGNASCRR